MIAYVIVNCQKGMAPGGLAEYSPILYEDKQSADRVRMNHRYPEGLKVSKIQCELTRPTKLVKELHFIK